MNEQTQKALDIAKEALFLIRASDPAYNAKTTYRVTNHERFGELLREFFDVEDRIRQAHTEQNLNKHLVMQAEGSDGAKGAAVGQRSVDTNAEAQAVTHGICKERNCNKPATKDYNGHEHWVCDYHYDKLNDEFDEEYR